MGLEAVNALGGFASADDEQACSHWVQACQHALSAPPNHPFLHDWRIYWGIQAVWGLLSACALLKQRRVDKAHVTD